MRSLPFAAIAAGALAVAAPGPALAYCIHNDLKDREVSLLQDEHPSSKRQAARLNTALKPGTKFCCEPKNLDCNPDGKITAFVGVTVIVEGPTAHRCGPATVAGKERRVKVPGGGTVRIAANPKYDPKKNDGYSPYLVRITNHEGKDVVGPAGLPCR